MKIVVGLGNPGRKYEGTRHNVGFEVLDLLYERAGNGKLCGGRSKLRFEAETGDIGIGNERVLLVAPQTFMNASGRSVRQALDFFQVPLTDLLVLLDDLNLPTGKLRIRGSGTSGGQKGLENILQSVKSTDVARLRIGIGSPPPPMDAADYVLGRFGKTDRELIDSAIYRAAEAVEIWATQGLEAVMNRFNPPATKTDKSDKDGQER